MRKRKEIIESESESSQFLVLFWIGMSGGIVLQIIMGLVGIGGLIAVFTKNPESNLVTGTCDKCLKPDKSLAWNCQSGGCWAHICSDCQSVGEDQ